MKRYFSDQDDLLQPVEREVQEGFRQRAETLSKKKLLEEAVQAQEKRLIALTGNLPGFVYTFQLRPDGSEAFLYASPGIRDIYGLRTEEVLADLSTLRNLFGESEKVRFKAAIIESARTGEQFHQEFRIHHPQKGVRWLESRSMPEARQDGSTIWHGVTLDVTDRKAGQLQAQLIEVAVQHSGEAMYIIKPDEGGRLAFVNDAACRLSGYSREELPALTPFDLAPLLRSSDVPKLREKLAPGRHVSFESIHRRKDGSLFPVEIVAYEIEFQGEALGIFAVRDITGRRQTEQALARKEREFRMLAENSPDTIARYDCNCVRTYANRTLARLTGLPTEALLGKKPTDYTTSPEAVAYETMMKAVIESGEMGEMEYTWPDTLGNQLTSHIRIVPEYDEGGKVVSVLSTGRDITRMLEIQEKMKHLARHDSLTGLPNRKTVQERTDRAIAAARRRKGKVALLFVDLDNFKAINDSLGHDTGDMLLQEISARLRLCVREIDTVGRQGGDEFVITLTEIEGADDIVRVVARIFQQFEQSIPIDGHPLFTSMSIGIALYPDDGDSFEVLLKKADTSMYEAKRAGRNTYSFFSEQMNHSTLEHLLMHSDLKRALSGGELLLHFQPQIGVASGGVVGAEVLLRWQHPKAGMIAPGRFIPVAEANGLIVPIGEWVLHEACRQAARWREIFSRPITVAVNISAMQFIRSNLEATILSALEKSGLPPELLELELTESIFIHHAEQTLETVRRLKDRGIRIAIDDFGTGYSSLAYLKRFAANVIKIDRTFICNIANDADDVAIVRAVIQLAKSLGIATIAEGVEDHATVDLLADLECDAIQGFVFSKPLNQSDFETFYKKSLRHK